MNDAATRRLGFLLPSFLLAERARVAACDARRKRHDPYTPLSLPPSALLYYTLMAKPLATTATAAAAVPTGDAHPPDTNPSLDGTGEREREREREREGER